MTLFRTNSILAGTVLALGVVSASWAEDSRSASKIQSGTEVLTEMYQCSGSVYSDGQNQNVQAVVYFSGTSDLVSEFAPLPAETRDAPADLEEMDRICASHLEEARASASSICTLTPVTTFRGEFGNGASSGRSFRFVCEGRRDAVIRAVGGFSRSLVLAVLQ